MSYPLQFAGFFTDYIKAAGWLATGEMLLYQFGQKVSRRAQQAPLLVAVYTGGGPAMAGRTTISDFHEHQYLALTGDKVDFTRLAQEIAFEHVQAVAFQPVCGAALR